MAFTPCAAGRHGHRKYYVAQYHPDDRIRLPFDGLPFACLIHRGEGSLTPAQVGALVRALLAENARAFYCVGLGAKTMKEIVENVTIGEGWTRKHRCPIPVSWRETTDATQASEDFKLVEPGDDTVAHYGLVVVTSPHDGIEPYLEALGE